jgi:glycolate oxidase iron-sulfur subunit
VAKKSSFEILEREREEINRCFRCGLCRSVCPSFEESGLESASPRGRVQFAKAALDGKIGFDTVFRERILDCLNCMKCAETCPSGIRTDRIALSARAELVKKGKLDLIPKLIFNGVIKNPFFMKLCAQTGYFSQKWLFEPEGFLDTIVPRCAGMEDKRLPMFTDKPAVKRWPSVNHALYGEKIMRVGYFIGCATNFLYPEVADATIRVLTRNKIEVVIPKGQVCCGIPVYSSGDFNNARKLAEKNRSVFSRHIIDCIITDCSSCSAALKHDITELLDVKPFDVPVYDLNEFLIHGISINRDVGEVPLKVTYHDPCHLKRGQSIFREPRELLSLVPGLELIEMKDADMCCGGAGTFSLTHHELSRKIGGRKAERIRDTGAHYIATPCPSCRMQLEDIMKHHGMNVGIIHPVEILEMAYAKRDIQDSDFIVIDS